VAAGHPLCVPSATSKHLPAELQASTAKGQADSQLQFAKCVPSATSKQSPAEGQASTAKGQARLLSYKPVLPRDKP